MNDLINFTYEKYVYEQVEKDTPPQIEKSLLTVGSVGSIGRCFAGISVGFFTVTTEIYNFFLLLVNARMGSSCSILYTALQLFYRFFILHAR
jgi:hypothetical protein